VFLDEAHAALPTKLWSQNWLWLKELAQRWGCRFVFASGSLARFWEDADIVKEPVKLPELLPPRQAAAVLDAERHRVSYRSLDDGRCVTVGRLSEVVHAAPGPRLVVLNTVQNAAVVARAMRKSLMNVLHLSTALCPGDRANVLRRVIRRLEAGWRDWTLVATSCVEAGVDLSFRNAFRERFAVASSLQIGGRVNRHGEYDAYGGGVVYDFALDDQHITIHPAAEVSADILREMLAVGEFNNPNPADVVTRAMREELRRLGARSGERLRNAESRRDYPEVAKLGRVIGDDTRLVVVDPRLKKRLRAGRPVGFRSLLDGSVQLWSNKIDKLGCERVEGRGEELFLWNLRYDPDLLGSWPECLGPRNSLSRAGMSFRGPPAVFTESDLLPISALQHLLYCERQCALIHVERLWAENRFTAEGTILHRKAHGGKPTTRPRERSLRGVPVHSYELGLYGIADVVATKGSGPAMPVEYKRGRPKKNDCDRVQLCAQALCLEEMTGHPVARGEIFYGKVRRRVPVEMSPELRRLTIETAVRLHDLIRSRRMPPAEPGRKCDRCSLQGLCLPRLGRLGSAGAAFDRLLDAIIPEAVDPGAIDP
jgi:CRISPR-associated protein Cas4